MKEVENESRKMGLDILNKLNSVADAQYPVGYVYTQYSGQTAPALLFGGTWTDITFTSLPTQIYDSGSNANGSWIRYTDGTMMCWNRFADGGYNGSTGASAVMIYREITWTFPQQFADTNRIVVGSAYANTGVQNGVGLMEQSQFIAVGSARLFVFGLNSANMTGQATAIGKWK
jgi:hypothetical protein